MGTPTHEVLNQPPALEHYSVLESDSVLRDAIAQESPSGAFPELAELARLAGSAQAQTWAVQANEHPPKLHTHDRYGHRVDEVEFHPAYHQLMEIATRFGLHAAPWAQNTPDAHLERAAKFFVWAQVEAGHGCPISMTYAAVPALRAQPELARVWEPRLCARGYDPRLDSAGAKPSALCGMAMTEKQGGSDVRANRTQATFLESTGLGDAYALTGHKWFCSAPMSDAFLVLAQTGDGLTCFLMPRILPDGSRNDFRILRLKDKLGNRSNASSEVEFDATWAIAVGESGRGVQTIVEMVNYTRLDCINGSAALMRQAVAQAIHHASHRTAFGKTLVDQPLMRNVLADLAIESEAATRLLFRLARAVDGAPGSEAESAVKRLGTAVGKFYVCKRAAAVAAEALECLGGNGYVEESPMPRLYREAPLNSIWEGSGNINALDVLRILSKQRGAIEAFRAELALTDPRIAREAGALDAAIREDAADESRARALVERIAVVWQASLLVRASSIAADAFIASRIEGDWGRTFGTLASSSEHASIVQRARPAAFVE